MNNCRPVIKSLIAIGLFAWLVLFSTIAMQAQSATDLNKRIAADYSYLEQLYLHLHKHPELSFFEKNTSRRMAEELRSLGFEVTENIGGFGLVGRLRNGSGPTLLIRADMDGLPVIEETGKEYASKVTTTDELGRTVGVMHACGHDVHMTVWVGAARMLASMKDQWKGTLIFVGQPAEERSGGAKAMLAENLFGRFGVPDYCLALHVSSSLPAGNVGLCPGYSMANVDMLDITVYGRGGHGAAPHTTIDPVVLAAKLILDLQTIVSREVSPTDAAVVTVGSIHGGAKGNVIPNEVNLELTLRSYSDEVRQSLITGINRRCHAAAISAGLPDDKRPVVTLRDESTPALYNDPALTKRIMGVYQKLLGSDKVEEVPPVMTGEDFGRFGRTPEKVPVLLYWLGAVEPERIAAAKKGEAPFPSLHSATFAPLPEPTIKTGVLTMTSAVLDLLKK